MEALPWKISKRVLLLCSMVLACCSTTIQGCSYAKLDSGHTMCIFKPRMCSGKRHIKSGGLTCMDKEIILLSHNRLRQKLALGRVKSQPPAVNMQTMVWDEELARVAQRWADQCNPGHDRSRNIRHFTVGQNVAAVWTYESDVGSQPDFTTQIKAWFNEVIKFGFSKTKINPFKYSRVAGHYTQIAWADTYLVGCGFSYYFDKKWGYTKLYVCNYAPGGNVVGGTMYKMGFSGQMYCLPHGLRSNKRIQGLCERMDNHVSYDNQCAKEARMDTPPPSTMHITMKEPSFSMQPPPPMMTMRPSMMMMQPPPRRMMTMMPTPAMIITPPPPRRRHPNSIPNPNFSGRFTQVSSRPSNFIDGNARHNAFDGNSRISSPLGTLRDIIDRFKFIKRNLG